jgi:alpha/beta superfamily hydrolase
MKGGHSMRRQSCLLLVLLAAAGLNACGGGGGSASNPAPNLARGSLLVSPPAKVASFSAADLLALLGVSDQGKLILQLGSTPVCAVDVHQLKYETADPASNLTPASGALMVPSGSDPSCQGARPVLLYAHGTTTDRNFNIASISTSNSEGLLLAAEFAARGYIVVAPNYVGYDSSTLAFHPYLNADQQSKDMIDALTAARSALPTSAAPSTTAGAKLFVTGYSQGGYVAMATHRAMQAGGMAVTASAPLSGPYALSAFGDAIFEGQVSASATVNVTLLASSYQHSYSNVYSSPGDVFEPKYAPTIDELLPGTVSVPQLQSQGKLPAGGALFDTMPPSAAFASLTPATQPATLAAIFAQGFGADHLVGNAYRLAYLQDAQMAPDGGFPNRTDGLPPANPANKLRQDLKTNDLRNWTPTSPVLLCAGGSDPTVFYMNTALMRDYWGANPPSGVAISVLDVESIKAFAAAKDAVRLAAVLAGATDGGDLAVLDAYHAGLVPPFCFDAVKTFFDAH